jgi:hypothetical protein
MPIWTRQKPPTYFPEAGLTKSGWINPDTRELLVAMQDGENEIGPGTGLVHRMVGGARIQTRLSHSLQAHGAIQNTSTTSTVGLARIYVTVRPTLIGHGNIRNTTIKTAIGRTAVRNTTLVGIVGGTSVRKTAVRTVSGEATVVHRLNTVPAPLVEYPFYKAASSMQVVDYSGKYTGDLSDPVTWSRFGATFDGSQYVSLPNEVLFRANQNFTIFFIVWLDEISTNSKENLIYWGDDAIKSSFDIHVNQTDGFGVDLNGPAWKNKYVPPPKIPLTTVVRYHSDGQLDIRIAEGFNDISQVGVYDFSTQIPFFLPHNGTLAKNFVGTMYYCAMWDSYLSNGETRELFKFAKDTLLTKFQNVTPSFASNAFDPEAFG